MMRWYYGDGHFPEKHDLRNAAVEATLRIVSCSAVLVACWLALAGVIG